ncbi:hypothetical protein QW060_18850 [Myroides ceti]|uniref:Uncharacterized protein n=1 Tax=Paenimyroides ceti TaxID=395087 RepID=A0ABT8CX20_9FLAO|nr:hypothetical protein [Paenimyroides ceti]MDN3708656.1 hypothetical protein [Paenimyroides ceti]MDN3709113.1 hypothetical protein [Paenimyroides ceti]
MGNSVNLSVGIGIASGGIEYGGTQGNGFSNFGNRTESNSRPYIYYGGGQSSQYPSTGIQVGKVSVGAMISSTRTWVLKL